MCSSAPSSAVSRARADVRRDPAHRRVHHVDPGEPAGHRPQGRLPAGHVRGEHGAVRQGGGQRHGDLRYLLVAEDAEQQHAGPGGGLRQLGCGPDAELRQGGLGLGPARVHHEVMPGGGEPLDHRKAHPPGTDKPDPRGTHRLPPVAPVPAAVAAPRCQSDHSRLFSYTISLKLGRAAGTRTAGGLMSDAAHGAAPFETAPRPPEGDWLGTPYLSFELFLQFAATTVDRPEARNALTQAMYFGIRYAVRRVDADPELAGLLITGTGDVFIPGGDLGKKVSDKWADFNAAPGAFDVLPFDVLRQSVKPVVSAVNGFCQVGGLLIAMCSDLAVVSERATFRVPELLRGISDTYYAQLLV